MADPKPRARSFDDEDKASPSLTLPHSMEAEQAVLGGLMRDANRFDAVAELVSPDDFFRDDHRQIFTMMQRLIAAEQPIDAVTLVDELDRNGELERVGGHGYLLDLAANTPSAANVAAYARIIRERATLRALISAANEISQTSMNPAGLDSDDLLQLAERRVAAIAEDRPKEGGFIGAESLLHQAVSRIDELFRTDSDLTGISTGLQDLNERTAGWQPGELIILAARPSMGKTALALNFVEAALASTSKPALVFSMEMPSVSLIMRMLSSLGRIDAGKLRNGKLTEEDWPKLSSAVAKLKDKPLYIDDTPALSPQEVRARIKRVVRQHFGKLQQENPDTPSEELEALAQPGMVMVDYLQLMQIANYTEGRTQEISEISRSLKGIAKEFNCPVIALSQLNRGVEQRPNKRPMNSDLRESGAIEQDADVILFIYRDEYYNEDSPDKGVAELIIGKQRNGEIGTSKAAFVGKYTRFENLAPDYMAQPDYGP
ncbi:replicative DNA helicase [Simiduia agarivorans]|uniref:Replicative DNA helicase n=1 Tax=Simiduia agarivorans (strain DSM 21679 / JCM 13881 / BCRC 17597 / SA1) TaxID=1117647 RepID=K4KLY4_SIMAS|nr:replicative DNA helicase [Simiduia agarivorans]AFU99225.1 replicative DNA helicase [Simiduia agarivorans SA1 = DSM 21679]